MKEINKKDVSLNKNQHTYSEKDRDLPRAEECSYIEVNGQVTVCCCDDDGNNCSCTGLV